MWTWTSWPKWPTASLELILQRFASGRVSWPSERASKMKSAERGRGRPTHQLWSALFPSAFSHLDEHLHATAVLLLLSFYTLLTCSFHRRWKRMILCQRSGRTTLKRQCDLLVAPSVTMTFANMRCLLRHCSRAVASAASGTFIHTFCIGISGGGWSKLCRMTLWKWGVNISAVFHKSRFFFFVVFFLNSILEEC